MLWFLVLQMLGDEWDSATVDKMDCFHYLKMVEFGVMGTTLFVFAILFLIVVSQSNKWFIFIFAIFVIVIGGLSHILRN